LARILDGLYEFLATASGRPSHSRWGDKTPLNTRHLDAIASVFPSALFIHLLRDGYDVTESAMRVEGKRFGDPVAAARHWQQAVRLARDFASRRPNSCVEVRYEDLVSQPAPVLEKLCAKLDLPFFPEMLAVDDEQVSTMGDVVALAHHANTRQPIDSRLAGQGRSRLAPETLQLLQQLIGPDMARVGYDPEISL
jgi:protein-tyrosine sulfotransferase